MCCLAPLAGLTPLVPPDRPHSHAHSSSRTTTHTPSRWGGAAAYKVGPARSLGHSVRRRRASRGSDTSAVGKSESTLGQGRLSPCAHTPPPTRTAGARHPHLSSSARRLSSSFRSLSFVTSSVAMCLKMPTVAAVNSSSIAALETLDRAKWTRL